MDYKPGNSKVSYFINMKEKKNKANKKKIQLYNSFECQLNYK